MKSSVNSISHRLFTTIKSLITLILLIIIIGVGVVVIVDEYFLFFYGVYHGEVLEERLFFGIYVGVGVLVEGILMGFLGSVETFLIEVCFLG